MFGKVALPPKQNDTTQIEYEEVENTRYPYSHLYWFHFIIHV